MSLNRDELSLAKNMTVIRHKGFIDITQEQLHEPVHGGFPNIPYDNSINIDDVFNALEN